MIKIYKQLTTDERSFIQPELKVKLTPSQIALVLSS